MLARGAHLSMKMPMLRRVLHGYDRRRFEYPVDRAKHYGSRPYFSDRCHASHVRESRSSGNPTVEQTLRNGVLRAGYTPWRSIHHHHRSENRAPVSAVGDIRASRDTRSARTSASASLSNHVRRLKNQRFCCVQALAQEQ